MEYFETSKGKVVAVANMKEFREYYPTVFLRPISYAEFSKREKIDNFEQENEEVKLKYGQYIFLNSVGEVVIKKLKDLGKNVSWESLNRVDCDSVSKSESEFLHKYGLETTIFNVGSLQKFGLIHLYPHFIEVVLSHGAIDRRTQ